MTQEQLERLGWFFAIRWIPTVQLWAVTVSRRAWGYAECFRRASREESVDAARAWASNEEFLVNRRDTLPAPSMGAAE